MKHMQARHADIELVVLSSKPYSVVPAYMNACDVLALTSDAEGSPMVVKEAMACNLAVVATAAGDAADVIGRTAGCYVTSQDPAEIAAKIELALSPVARTLGREMVQEMELDAISRRIIEVYEELVQARRGGRLEMPRERATTR